MAPFFETVLEASATEYVVDEKNAAHPTHGHLMLVTKTLELSPTALFYGRSSIPIVRSH